MELHIKSSFDCVYLINGEFFETADALNVSEFDIVYVIAFPLKPMLLPYAVRINCTEPISSDLYNGIRLDEKHYLLSLFPKYMTVYGTAQKACASAPSPISRLFSLVKSGDLTAAYAMLSESLRGTIEKPDLDAFFAEFERLEECYWESPYKFYLIDKNGAHAYTYAMKDEFIDDITELG